MSDENGGGEVYAGRVGITWGSGTVEVTHSSEEALEGTFAFEAPLTAQCEFVGEGRHTCEGMEPDENRMIEAAGSFTAVPASAEGGGPF